MFEIEFTPTIIKLFSIVVVLALYLLLGFVRYVAKVRRQIINDNKASFGSETSAYPSVSVIVYSEDDASNLETLLPQILEQDYDGLFEVVVVNDGAVASTKDVIARLEQRYSNLYMTFTPMGSRALSRKKLAITLGIKAARYETVLLTSGNCRIESKTWIKTMMRHFADGKDIVIGYATPLIPKDVPNPRKRLHAFDQVRTAIKYLSWAIAGRPYRGTCHNLAYRRSVFFDNKGFSQSFKLKYGDDDIFVNQVTNKNNTAVELSTESIVEILETQPAAIHKNDKLRYNFTGKMLRSGVHLFFGSCSLVWWLFNATVVVASLAGLPSLIPMIASITIWLTIVVTLMVVWHKTSKALGSRPLLLTVPWFMTIEPIYNFYYRIKGMKRNNRDQNSSWTN